MELPVVFMAGYWPLVWVRELSNAGGGPYVGAWCIFEPTSA